MSKRCFIVVHAFKDLQDNDYVYDKIGAKFPRDGVNVEDISEERLNQLLTENNLIGCPVIHELYVDSSKETELEENLEESSKEIEPKENLEDNSEENNNSKNGQKNRNTKGN